MRHGGVVMDCIKTKSICLFCGIDYVKNHEKRKFCSQKCYIKNKQSHVKKRNCFECSKEIVVIGKSKVKFCSRKCYFNFKKKNPKEKYTYKKCEYCKKQFNTLIRKVSERKFCSKECLRLSYLSEKNPLRKRKKIVCLNCGIEKEIPNYLESKFCSRACCNNWLTISGERKKIAKKNTTGEYKKCLHCGSEYWAHKYRKNTIKFCSISCYDNYRRTKIKCPSCGKHFIFPNYEKRKYCSQNCYCKGFEKRKSKFFVSVYNYIIENFPDTKIEPEKPIFTENNKYYVDILLEDYVIIECYGDYWHCNPIKFSEEYFHSKIKKYAKEIWEKDKVREERLKEKGFKIVVLWEKNWSDDKDFFNTIKDKINEILKS